MLPLLKPLVELGGGDIIDYMTSIRKYGKANILGRDDLWLERVELFLRLDDVVVCIDGLEPGYKKSTGTGLFKEDTSCIERVPLGAEIVQEENSLIGISE